ncbi:hypothetical protein EV182_001726 [Spiromyces aspiralis]|uniref:Uncharacterized protein n=1 Tax=Spiromyces aspiralis TaxID=68401 RepID=A0ACC1HMR0_9FUNG|nr:hypothetical protein EV182_001726 [Spiromyces aspiralis]
MPPAGSSPPTHQQRVIAFITAYDFFHYKLRGSSYEDNFMNYFAACYTLSNLAFTIYSQLTFNKALLVGRICGGLSLCLTTFVLTMFFPSMSKLEGTLAFYIFLGSLIAASAGTGLAQPSIYAYCSPMPHIYIQGIMSGQAIAGLAASVIQLLTAYSTASPRSLHLLDPVADAPPKILLRTTVYFLVVSLIAAMGLASFIFIRRHPVYLDSVAATGWQQAHQEAAPADQDRGSGSPAIPTCRDSSLVRDLMPIRHYMWAVVTVFMTTISLFPAITSLVSSADSRHPTRFLKEWHFLALNVGDLAGRQLSTVPVLFEWFKSGRTLNLAAQLRWLFVPLVLSCNIVYSNGDGSHQGFFAGLITSDLAFLTIVLALGVTTGFLVSLTMMMGPKASSNPERAGGALALGLAVGLALGSVMSFPVRALGCLCNPFE